MGFVSGMLGMAGGINGTGISGPNGAPIQSPTTTKQATNSYDANQNALAQQQGFLNQVQAQNGLSNQTSVYNQLQNVANGTGPNPAQAMLSNATGANVANQASLMAGQRGASSNVGLMARQAAQQGAATQQQAAGQGAAMQAQQSLGALQGLGAMANTQAAQQAQATGAVTSAQQNEQNQLLNSIAQQNNARVGMQSNVNSNNAALAGQTMQQQGQVFGNVMSGIGMAFADGGEVQDPNLDTSFLNPPTQSSQIPDATTGPKSNIGKSFHIDWDSGDSASKNRDSALGKGANQLGQGIGKGLKSLFSGAGGGTDAAAMGSMAMDSGMMMAAHGGKVPAKVSPGEQYLPPKDVEKVAKGANPLHTGERIPGKPKHPGNDYRNDTVSKTLTEGGVVIPNEIMQSKDAEKKAAAFVKAILAKNGSLPKKPRK